MRKPITLLTLFLVYFNSYLAFAINTISENTTATKPNVVIIVADQMRREALGFWQQTPFKNKLNGVSDKVHTPNLDELAAQGVVLNNAIANFPLCSPYRGMLMSGMYPHKNGVTNNARSDRPNVGLKTDVTALTDVLYQSGYTTALFGKSHWQAVKPLFDENGVYQGTEKSPGGHFIKETSYDTYVPPGKGRHGIEYWYQTIGHNHRNQLVYSNDPVPIEGKKDGEPHRSKEYSSVAEANHIIDYIKNTRQQRDTTKPFALLWAMDPPHNPYDSLEDTDATIYNKYYKNARFNDLINRPNTDPELAKQHIKYYFSMVTLIDREIGRVIKELEQQGIADNTLIIFTADHGEMMGSQGLMHKNYVNEESLAIPFIVRYPNKLSHRVDNLLMGVPDVMPTLLGLLNLNNRIPADVQGTDYSPLFFDPTSTQVKRPQSSLYYGRDNQLGVRTHQYTYAIDQHGALLALYNNIDDPYQMKPLTVKDIPAEDFIFLKKELGKWLVSIDHPVASQKQFSNMIIYP